MSNDLLFLLARQGLESFISGCHENLQEISLHFCYGLNDPITILARAPHLSSLSFMQCNAITTESFQQLPLLQSLQKLSVETCRNFNEDSFPQLALLSQLQSLSTSSRLTDDFWNKGSGLQWQNMLTLELNGTYLGDRFLKVCMWWPWCVYNSSSNLVMCWWISSAKAFGNKKDGDVMWCLLMVMVIVTAVTHRKIKIITFFFPTFFFLFLGGW